MKLVRDRIPELAGNGQRATFHQADSEEFGRLLRDKLLEETAEAASAPGQPSCWTSSATSPSPLRPRRPGRPQPGRDRVRPRPYRSLSPAAARTAGHEPGPARPGPSSSASSPACC
jgi:hypothetical protein